MALDGRTARIDNELNAIDDKVSALIGPRRQLAPR